MWYGTHKRGWRFCYVPPPIPHVIPPLIIISYWTLVYFVFLFLVLDFEWATPWYVNTMSWSNVPCAKLPP